MTYFVSYKSKFCFELWIILKNGKVGFLFNFHSFYYRLLFLIWAGIPKTQSFNLCPFLTLSVRNGPSVGFETNVSCISLSDLNWKLSDWDIPNPDLLINLELITWGEQAIFNLEVKKKRIKHWSQYPPF